MAITSISANVSCSHLEASIAWYGRLFGLPPARRPMAGLAEWSFSGSTEVQLFESRERAGHSILTVGVDDLAEERERLLRAGLQPGKIEDANHFTIMRVSDPDGNLVVLAAPKRAGPGNSPASSDDQK